MTNELQAALELLTAQACLLSDGSADASDAAAEREAALLHILAALCYPSYGCADESSSGANGRQTGAEKLPSLKLPARPEMEHKPWARGTLTKQRKRA